MYFLHTLQSEATGGFYIGQTQDVPERLAYHDANYSKSPPKILHPSNSF
jgi:predicted GIY-YIG superfamily endonuclease